MVHYITSIFSKIFTIGRRWWNLNFFSEFARSALATYYTQFHNSRCYCYINNNNKQVSVLYSGTTSHKICMQYGFVIFWLYCLYLIDSSYVFTYIMQDCFTGTMVIIPQCHWNYCTGYVQGMGKTKPNKHKNAQIMHIILGMFCVYPYPSGLLHWHWGNHKITPVPVKQPWRIWIKLTNNKTTTKHHKMWTMFVILVMSVTWSMLAYVWAQKSDV